MAEYILKIEDLRLNFYTYEGVVRALDGIQVSLKRGETLGIVGETGCGKSVTGLSILDIVLPPGKIENGKVIFTPRKRSVDLLSTRESIMRRIRGEYISMIFQDPRSTLNPVYTAGDQIAETLLVHKRKEELIRNAIARMDEEIKAKETKEKTPKGAKKPKKAGLLTKYYKGVFQKMLSNPGSLSLHIISRIPILRRYKRILNQEAKKEAVNMLRLMRIPDPERVVDMYPHELSGGMAQRVVIAIALACNPEVLIADEPTTNLDVTVQLQILRLLKELREKFSSSIIYVTHDMGIVAEMCDRVAVMYAGNVVELSGVLDIFKRPLHPYTQGLLQAIPRPGVPFKSIEGTVPSLIDPPKGCRFHNRCNYAMDICTKVKPKAVEVEKDHFVECFLYE
jgi:peptide/nickel transport system ATP-binding protein